MKINLNKEFKIVFIWSSIDKKFSMDSCLIPYDTISNAISDWDQETYPDYQYEDKLYYKKDLKRGYIRTLFTLDENHTIRFYKHDLKKGATKLIREIAYTDGEKYIYLMVAANGAYTYGTSMSEVFKKSLELNPAKEIVIFEISLDKYKSGEYHLNGYNLSDCEKCANFVKTHTGKESYDEMMKYAQFQMYWVDRAGKITSYLMDTGDDRNPRGLPDFLDEKIFATFREDLWKHWETDTNNKPQLEYGTVFDYK